LKRGNRGDASGASVQFLRLDGGWLPVVHGVAAHRERWRWCRASKEEERAPGGPVTGREAGKALAGKGISTKNQVGLPRLLGRIEELNRKASIIIFEYIFKAFGFKFKGFKYFQTKFELMSTWNKLK
jgi:hypothetical protein